MDGWMKERLWYKARGDPSITWGIKYAQDLALKQTIKQWCYSYSGVDKEICFSLREENINMVA